MRRASAGSVGCNDQDMELARPDMSWRALYRAGGVSALLFVLLVVVPVALVFLAPLPPTEGAPLLEYIAEHKAVYLTQLVSFVALKDLDKSTVVIGGLFGVASEIIALALGSSPQSLHGGLMILSDAYAAAGTEGERAGLVNAAEALIAATNAVSWGGILTAAGILVLSLVMRRGVFGRSTAIIGILAGSVGILSEAFRPLIGSAYLLYGLLLPIWFAMVGWRLLRLERQDRDVGDGARPEPGPGARVTPAP